MTGRKHPPTHRKKRAEIGPRPYLDNIETPAVISEGRNGLLGYAPSKQLKSIGVDKGPPIVL